MAREYIHTISVLLLLRSRRDLHLRQAGLMPANGYCGLIDEGPLDATFHVLSDVNAAGFLGLATTRSPNFGLHPRSEPASSSSVRRDLSTFTLRQRLRHFGNVIQ